MAKTAVAELQALLRRGVVRRLERDYDLEASAAEGALDLIDAGFGEGPAVAEVLRTLEASGPDAVAGRVAEIIGWRANA